MRAVVDRGDLVPDVGLTFVVVLLSMYVLPRCALAIGVRMGQTEFMQADLGSWLVRILSVRVRVVAADAIAMASEIVASLDSVLAFFFVD